MTQVRGEMAELRSEMTERFASVHDVLGVMHAKIDRVGASSRRHRKR